MKKYLLSKILVLAVIILIILVNGASCINIKKRSDCSITIGSEEDIIKNYEDDGKIHTYFSVDFNITVHEAIGCKYVIFDIQGKEYVPFFNAIRLFWSGSPVIDITIDRINGQTLEFSLEGRVFILALRLNDVKTNLPNFRNAYNGYIEGHSSFIIFF